MQQPPDYPRNQVGIDDLKKLTRNARSNQSGGAFGAGPGGPVSALGPSNMMSSRSNSGRKGLGPALVAKEESGAGSRTGTPPVKEQGASRNAFELLATHGDTPDDAVSPPSTQNNSPALAKSAPAQKGSEEKKAS